MLLFETFLVEKPLSKSYPVLIFFLVTCQRNILSRSFNDETWMPLSKVLWLKHSSMIPNIKFHWNSFNVIVFIKSKDFGLIFIPSYQEYKLCVFPLHIGPDSWKISDIAFLWVSFHNPPGNWPVRATTCWINHFYFAFQNNVGLSVQQNNNYGTPTFVNPSNMDKICGFTEETPYFFNTKLVTSYHYVLKPRACKLWRRK